MGRVGATQGRILSLGRSHSPCPLTLLCVVQSLTHSLPIHLPAQAICPLRPVPCVCGLRQCVGGG